MPAINIGDIQIPVQMVQNTTPSLKVMDASGMIYYVDAMMGACPDAVKVSDGENVYSIGTQTLVHEVSGINSCETVSLAPGCYYVEVRGGRGAVQAKFTLAQNLDGGAGGSGSTGTSASSFVRIYKFG